MKLFISSTIFTITCFFLFNGVVFSQSADVIQVADTNVTAELADRVGNVFAINLTISNGNGSQSGVRYSVRLVQKGDPGVTIDEEIYSEALSLAPQTITKKNIVYTPKGYLSGLYDLLVFVGNEEGLLLGVARLGEVTLTSTDQWLTVSPETCTLSVEGKEGKKTYSISSQPVLSSGQTLELACEVVNTGKVPVSITSELTTYDKTLYGDLIIAEPFQGKTLTITPGGKKRLSLAIPVVDNSGVYKNILKLSSSISAESYDVFFGYNRAGFPTSLVNISLDKDMYQKGDTAQLQVLSRVGIPFPRKITAKIVSGWSLCGKTEIENPTAVQTIEVTMKRTCVDPEVTVTFVDASGTTISEKTVKIETLPEHAPRGIFSGPWGGVILLGLLILVVFIGLFVRKHFKKEAVATLAILFFAFTPFSVDAATFWIGSSQDIEVNVSVDNPQNPGSTTYSNGDTMIVNGWMQTSSSLTRNVSLSAVNAGGASVNIFPAVVALGPSNPNQLGQPGTFTVNVTPPLPQTLNVTFTAGVEESITPIYVSTSYSEVNPPAGSCTMYPNGEPLPGEYFDGPILATYSASFFNSIADYYNNIPLNVSGRNLKLRYSYEYSVPNCIYGVCVPPTSSGSGTTYTPFMTETTDTMLSNLLVGRFYQGQYVPEDCEYYWSGWGGATLLDGSSESVPYYVITSMPTAFITAPYGVYSGEPFNLSWSSTDATSCVGSNFSTGGAVSGTTSETISGDTTYTVTCTNIMGTATDSTTVLDLGPRPPQNCGPDGCKNE